MSIGILAIKAATASGSPTPVVQPARAHTPRFCHSFSNVRRANISAGLPFFIPECWILFAPMKNLKELHIDILNSREELLDIRGFSALKRLSSTTQSWESVGYALHSITSKCPERIQMSRYISFNSMFPGGRSALKDTFATFRTKFGHSLRCIEINTPFCVTDADDDGMVNLVSDCLSRADSAVDVQLSDDDLEAMAAAWPRLARLSLLLGKSFHISTSTLAALANWCPLLIVLELSTVVVCSTQSNPAPHGMQWLTIVDYVDAPADFAAFLNAVFPDAMLVRRDDEAEPVGETLVASMQLQEVYRHLMELKTT
ncbi:hypothetical protein OBBRIDRAFT_827842 [Obba rivulosa]|uniref:Uncharacterized protein n=1 Tax=Obba rivulosa TaxID=1052685 RepID=A0A8E2ARW8_9APHY|nr:hypothetical protein OBBRIDRAFT_827842 [Obba rivulosa]